MRKREQFAESEAGTSSPGSIYRRLDTMLVLSISVGWKIIQPQSRRSKMRRAVLLGVVALSLIVIATTSFVSNANSALSKAEDDFQLVKVAEGIYAAIAKPGGLASGNAGFIVGDGGVLMVDTFFTPAAVEELITEIAAQTKQPIKYAVNTHYHLDHTGGNQVLAARGVPIIAHDNVMNWQMTKNNRFLPAAAALQKRRADPEKQLSETPADQNDKRTTFARQLRRLYA